MDRPQTIDLKDHPQTIDLKDPLDLRRDVLNDQDKSKIRERDCSVRKGNDRKLIDKLVRLIEFCKTSEYLSKIPSYIHTTLNNYHLIFSNNILSIAAKDIHMLRKDT